jgi:hypothetical protein
VFQNIESILNRYTDHTDEVELSVFNAFASDYNRIKNMLTSNLADTSISLEEAKAINIFKAIRTVYEASEYDVPILPPLTTVSKFSAELNLLVAAGVASVSFEVTIGGSSKLLTYSFQVTTEAIDDFV